MSIHDADWRPASSLAGCRFVAATRPPRRCWYRIHNTAGPGQRGTRNFSGFVATTPRGRGSSGDNPPLPRTQGQAPRDVRAFCIEAVTIGLGSSVTARRWPGRHALGQLEKWACSKPTPLQTSVARRGPTLARIPLPSQTLRCRADDFGGQFGRRALGDDLAAVHYIRTGARTP